MSGTVRDDVSLTGLQAEAELGPWHDRGRRGLGGRGGRGHREAPLAPHGVDHLALRSLGPQGADLHGRDRQRMVRVRPGWLSGKESPANAGDAGDGGSIPGSGRSPGEGHGNPLQYSCLENSMDRGAWRATVRGVRKNRR